MRSGAPAFRTTCVKTNFFVVLHSVTLRAEFRISKVLWSGVSQNNKEYQNNPFGREERVICLHTGGLEDAILAQASCYLDIIQQQGQPAICKPEDHGMYLKKTAEQSKPFRMPFAGDDPRS